MKQSPHVATLLPMMLLIPLVLMLTACQPDEGSSSADGETMTATDPATDTCAACGMVMREQPAPRGQVVHRDGTRAFLCSIDDLVQYLDIPSPAGKPARVYAEVMPDEHESKDMNPAWQPWFDVAELFFVTGIERGAVMGEPIMTYRTRAAAEKAAEKWDGTVITFEQLRAANRK